MRWLWPVLGVGLWLLTAPTGVRAGAEVHGCPTLPPDNAWNTPVIGLPVHPRSAAYLASIGLDTGLHADFGSGLWEGGPIGIPYTVVTSATPLAPVEFVEYGDESDPGPYRVPLDAPIEGGPSSTGDRHVLAVDREACLLYELYHARSGPGGWQAGSGAVFNLRSNALRPAGWTSADAAGLPILPGLVRYDEVAAGVIPHALRFTVARSQRATVWPARHFASSLTDPNLPPMGLRVRLRASFDVSPFPPTVQTILRAMQTYGMLVADNGSSWFVSGAPDARWDNDALRTLRSVHGADFEVVDTGGMMISPDSGRARPPCAWLDFNANGAVDQGDLQALAAQWPARPVPAAQARYDLDGDGDIDVADLQQASLRWGLSCVGGG